MVRRQAIHAVALLCCLLIQILPESLAAEVSPATITDTYGNTVDINSTITWADIPAGKPYADTSDEENSVDGLQLLYTGMTGFVNAVFSQEIPWELIRDVVAGNKAIGDVYQDLLKFGAGVLACIIIGFLFILIWPLVGCCCLCFRCRKRSPKDKRQPASKFGGCILFIFVLVTDLLFMVGLVCTYYTNERMTRSLSIISPTLDNGLSDLTLYGNNTLDELKYATRETFTFTSDVINRDLDNIGPLIGGPVRAGFEGLGLKTAFDSLYELDPLVANLSGSLLNVQTAVTNTNSSVMALSASLTSVKAGLDTTLTKCGGSCSGSGIDTTQLATDFSADSLPDFSSESDALAEVNNVNLTSLVESGQAQFNNIDSNITTESASAVAAIKATIEAFKGTLNTSLGPAEDMLGLFGNLTSGLDGMRTYLEQGANYEKYRYYAGTALCCFLLFILILHFMGFLFVLLSGRLSSSEDEQLQPNCASSTGKNMILCSTWLAFGCGAPLMILVTLTFTIGAPLDKVICQNIQYPDFTLFAQMIDGGPNGYTILPDVPANGYSLGKLLLDDENVALTASSLLTDCHNGQSAWNALHLEKFINLSDATNYKKNIDIETEIETINVDLTTIDIVDDNLKTELDKMKTNLQSIDYSGLRTELEKPTAAADLGAFATSLNSLANTLEGQVNAGTITGATAVTVTEVVGELRGHATTVNNIETNEAAAVSTSQAEILNTVNALNTSSVTVPARMDAIVADLEVTQTRIQSSGGDIIKNESRIYANRVLGVADQFVTFALNTVQNVMGACTPLWSAYDRLINSLLCTNFVSVLNAFWFTLGWCIFSFVVGAILSIKTANRVSHNTYAATGRVSPSPP